MEAYCMPNELITSSQTIIYVIYSYILSSLFLRYFFGYFYCIVFYVILFCSAPMSSIEAALYKFIL